MNILITGGAGFIGSNFVEYMLNKYPEYNVINVDSLTYAGNLENLKKVAHHPNYTFYKADIRNRKMMDKIFKNHQINMVVNLAAESHVDRSIIEPEVFLTTNIIGTSILLDVAISHWKIHPEDKYSREYKNNVKFLQVSTDEVYGELGPVGKFVETMPLLPNSPYSASKASADLLVRSYRKTFGLPMNITRCSNNYGPYQFPEKLIPLMIHNSLNDQELPLYGDGRQIRDWLHVKDHCSALDVVLHEGSDGEVYNIGGNNEKTNLEIVKVIISILKKSEYLIKFVKDRPGHDWRYAIDNTKINKELNWTPSYTFEKGIKETIQWYVDHPEWINNVVSGEYMKYYNKMYNDS